MLQRCFEGGALAELRWHAVHAVVVAIVLSASTFIGCVGVDLHSLSRRRHVPVDHLVTAVSYISTSFSKRQSDTTYSTCPALVFAEGGGGDFPGFRRVVDGIFAIRYFSASSCAEPVEYKVAHLFI